MSATALLNETAGDFASAGWRGLHAAWACDDAEQGGEARVQRLAAPRGGMVHQVPRDRRMYAPESVNLDPVGGYLQGLPDQN